MKENTKLVLKNLEKGYNRYNRFNSYKRMALTIVSDPIIKMSKDFIMSKFHSKIVGLCLYQENRGYPDERFKSILTFVFKLNNPNTNKLLIRQKNAISINKNNIILNNCNDGKYMVKYKNHILIISTERNNDGENPKLYLSVDIYGKNPSMIINIIDGMDLYKQKFKIPSYKSFIIRQCNNVHERKRIHKREELFIDKLDIIDNYVERWIKNRGFYEKKNAIHKLCILLHGVPGDGKTTIAEYIAGKYSNDLIIINPFDNSYSIENRICNYTEEYFNSQKPLVFLLDDFEKAFPNREDENESGKRSDVRERDERLQYFLSLLDGTSSKDNCIFIFNTNYINKLDPAFKRPGRFDLELEIKPLVREEATKMIDFYLSDIYDNIDYESIFKDIKSEQDENYKYKNEDVYTPAEIKKQCLKISFSILNK